MELAWRSSESEALWIYAVEGKFRDEIRKMGLRWSSFHLTPRQVLRIKLTSAEWEEVREQRALGGHQLLIADS